jgi:hypothetical protein
VLDGTSPASGHSALTLRFAGPLPDVARFGEALSRM